MYIKDHHLKYKGAGNSFMRKLASDLFMNQDDFEKHCYVIWKKGMIRKAALETKSENELE